MRIRVELSQFYTVARSSLSNSHAICPMHCARPCPTAIHKPAATQHTLTARRVQEAMKRFGDDLGWQNRILRQPIDTLARRDSKDGLSLPA